MMDFFSFPELLQQKERKDCRFFFFFSFRKETWPILTSPLSMCLSTKALFEEALWFHDEDKPFLMPLSLTTVYLGLHFYMWNGNAFTYCPQTFLKLTHPSDFALLFPFMNQILFLLLCPYCSSPSRYNSNSAFSLKQSLPILIHNTTYIF